MPLRNQTEVSQSRVQISENEVDASAFLLQGSRLFTSQLAETSQLDEKQKTLSFYLHVYLDETVTTSGDWLLRTGRTRGKRKLVVVSDVPEAESVSAIDKTNSDRVELLARKYAAKDQLSSEESARLAIVTERLRQLLPSVTVNDYGRLDSMLQTVRKIDSADIAAREKLGLTKSK